MSDHISRRLECRPKCPVACHLFKSLLGEFRNVMKNCLSCVVYQIILKISTGKTALVNLLSKGLLPRNFAFEHTLNIIYFRWYCIWRNLAIKYCVLWNSPNMTHETRQVLPSLKSLKAYLNNSKITKQVLQLGLDNWKKLHLSILYKYKLWQSLFARI